MKQKLLGNKELTEFYVGCRHIGNRKQNALEVRVGLFFIFVVLEVDTSTFCILGETFTTEPHSQPKAVHFKCIYQLPSATIFSQTSSCSWIPVFYENYP